MKFCIPALLFVFSAGYVLGQAGDMETSYQNLKTAVEGKKSADDIQKLAAETHAIAQKTAAGGGEDAARAKEVEEYCDYALYDAAANAQPAKTAELMAALDRQNPKSKYLDEGGYWRWFAALRQTGGASKIPGIAAKGLANFPDNTDVLYELANSSLSGQRTAQAETYSNRLIAAIGKHPKPPAGTPQADWDRKLDSELGTAHWIVGVSQAGKNQYYQANKELREALPLIKGNEAMLEAAYFYLGLSNYQLGLTTLNKAQALEGVKYSEQAAKMKGPYTSQAEQNAQNMKNGVAKMR